MNAINVFHALGLHLHQPPGNLRYLIDASPWDAAQIVSAYQRPPRYARAYADVAHLHVGFSGTLLEQLRDPDIVDRYRHLVDIPRMLAAYRDAPNIELIGMGYFHPVFPLIPPADWMEQLIAGRDMLIDCFGRAPRGFWPSELAFEMAMIPALVKAGYDYVIVDSVHVHPRDGVDDGLRPYLACHEGVCISIVPCDRVLSQAQQSGLDPNWFVAEVMPRCARSARPSAPRLLTSWSGGENGGWFRQMEESAGFFGVFFAPYMERVRAGNSPIQPVALGDYLARERPLAEARVQTAGWMANTTSGFAFSRWAGSARQRQATAAIAALSHRYWSLRADCGRFGGAALDKLRIARRLSLEAQTSCYLAWGEDWLPRLENLLYRANALFDELALEVPARATGIPADGTATQPAAARHAGDL